MAEAFWKSFVSNLPEAVRPLQRNLAIAMQVGFIMSTFFGGTDVSEDEVHRVYDRLEWMRSLFGPASSKE